MRFKLTPDGRVFDSLIGKKFDPSQPKARRNAVELAVQGDPELYELIVRPTLNGGSIQFPTESGNSTPRSEAKARANSYSTNQKMLNTTNRVITPDQQLIIPTRFSTEILAQDDIADLYERSRVQAYGDKTFRHPGEEKLAANMLTRFFTSNVAAELVARDLRPLYPDAQAEVLSRSLKELNRGTDGGSDISGLPPTKSMDIKTVGVEKPSNVTSRVGNQLQRARMAGNPQSMLSFYEQKGGFIDNNDLLSLQTALNRFADRPQVFRLRGNILSNDFLDNASRDNLDGLVEQQFVLPKNFALGNNQMLIDYLGS